MSRSICFYVLFDVFDGKLGLYIGFGKFVEEWCKVGGEIVVGEGIIMIISVGYVVEVIDVVECGNLFEFFEWWWDDW